MKLCAGAKQDFASHWGAFALGFELFEVDLMTGQGGGNLPDDAGTIVAQEFEAGGGRQGGRSGWLGMDGDGKAFAFQCAERSQELRFLWSRHRGAQNAGELSAQPGHAALKPIAPVVRDGRGNAIHQAGSVAPQNRHDKVGVHAGQISGCG